LGALLDALPGVVGRASARRCTEALHRAGIETAA
jgi:hypothetical protein